MKFYHLLFAAATMLVSACTPKQADDLTPSMSRISVSGNHFVNAEGDSIVFRGLCCSDPIKLYNDSMWNERYFDEMGLHAFDTGQVLQAVSDGEKSQQIKNYDNA